MKKEKIRNFIFTIIFILGLTHIFILFRFLISDPLQSFLWGISVIFLISGLAFFLLSINKKFVKLKKRRLFLCEVLFTCIGAIIFITNSFIFIKKILISVLLVISVTLVFISLVLLQKWIVQDNKNEANLKDTEEING